VTETTTAYQSLTYFSIGLPDGEILQMRPGDLVPSDFAAANPHQVTQWQGDQTVMLVNVDPAEIG
jgi:hypothetical protein